MRERWQGAIACAWVLLFISYAFTWGSDTREEQIVNMCNNFGGFTIDDTLYTCSKVEAEVRP
jgi:hypothetical protein